MDYTREPIIETVITPKDGCKLAVRNSKGAGTEEYFVDALEVVSFGHSFFFRSLERPKSFLLPVGDYEVLEVREPRMALKHIGVERSIKIGGGKETPTKPSRETPLAETEEAPPVEPKLEKKRERRRYRRRRGQQEEKEESEREEEVDEQVPTDEVKSTRQAPTTKKENRKSKKENKKELELTSKEPESKVKEAETKSRDEEQKEEDSIPRLLQPPPKLISETISRYRENGMYSGAFFDGEAEDKPQIEGEPELKEEVDSECSEEVGAEEPTRFCEESEGSVEADPGSPEGISEGALEDAEATSLDAEASVGEVPESKEAHSESASKDANLEASEQEPVKGESEVSSDQEASSEKKADEVVQDKGERKRMSFADIVEELSENNS